jgi:hypothetical protein
VQGAIRSTGVEDQPEKMRHYRNKLGRGAEAMVVAVVLMITAAIVGPRMSRAAAPTPDCSEPLLIGGLKQMRAAIAEYEADHGAMPDERMVAQLTQFSDGHGNTSPTRTRRHVYGPYLRDIPVMPIGLHRGKTTVAIDGRGGSGAWVYDVRSGGIWANAPELDLEGRTYASY